MKRPPNRILPQIEAKLTEEQKLIQQGSSVSLIDEEAYILLSGVKETNIPKAWNIWTVFTIADWLQEEIPSKGSYTSSNMSPKEGRHVTLHRGPCLIITHIDNVKHIIPQRN